MYSQQCFMPGVDREVGKVQKTQDRNREKMCGQGASTAGLAPS